MFIVYGWVILSIVIYVIIVINDIPLVMLSMSSHNNVYINHPIDDTDTSPRPCGWHPALLAAAAAPSLRAQRPAARLVEPWASRPEPWGRGSFNGDLWDFHEHLMDIYDI